MYTLLRNLAQSTLTEGSLSSPGLTYVSVGHRPSLIAFHNMKLRLKGESGYDLETIDANVQMPTIPML